MAIKLTISDRFTYRVTGTTTTEAGAAEAFDFYLTARRLLQDELSRRLPEVAEGREPVDDFLGSVLVDWRGVLDDAGQPVPFSPEGLRALFNGVPGSAGLALSGYLEHVRAKAKN